MSFHIDAGAIAIIGTLIIIGAVSIILTWDYAFGTSEFKIGMDICTDIWQQTHNETLYYACWEPLDASMGNSEEN